MKEINPRDAQELVQKGDITIVDVRTPDEYRAGHIAGSVNINIADPTFLDKITAIPKEAICLVYCGSGGRSSRAAGTMTQQGFSDVYNLTGGITGWKRAGFSVEA